MKTNVKAKKKMTLRDKVERHITPRPQPRTIVVNGIEIDEKAVRLLLKTVDEYRLIEASRDHWSTRALRLQIAMQQAQKGMRRLRGQVVRQRAIVTKRDQRIKALEHNFFIAESTLRGIGDTLDRLSPLPVSSFMEEFGKKNPGFAEFVKALKVQPAEQARQPERK